MLWWVLSFLVIGRSFGGFCEKGGGGFFIFRNGDEVDVAD